MGPSWPRNTFDHLRTLRRRHGRNPVLWSSLAATALALTVAFSFPGLGNVLAIGEPPGDAPGARPPLHADGGRIVDARGHEVVLTGVNWFGLETGTFAPHGLWTRNWTQMLDQMAGA